MAISNITAPTCAQCQDVILSNEPVYKCDTCGKVHHVYCWERRFSCSTPNCGGSPSAMQVLAPAPAPADPASDAPANSCPICHYVLTPIDDECPRCANLRTRGIDPGTYSRQLGNRIPGFSEVPVAPVVNDEMEIDKELAKWNWGAFLLPLFWSAAMNLWGWFVIALIFQPVAMIYLGLRGNALAWGSRHWVDINHFRDTQRVWMKWGIGLTIASFAISLISIIVMIYISMMAFQGGLQVPPPAR